MPGRGGDVGVAYSRKYLKRTTAENRCRHLRSNGLHVEQVFADNPSTSALLFSPGMLPFMGSHHSLPRFALHNEEVEPVP